MHSEREWAAGTTQAIVVGVLALLTPLVSVLLSLDRRPVMPAVNAAASMVFIAVFLDRVGLSGDAITWILDGILLIALGALALRLRRAHDPEGTARALSAFVASLFAGLVLVGLTLAGPLEADTLAPVAMDLWLCLIVGLALWGLHRSPLHLRRDWYETILASCVVLAIPLGSWTMAEFEAPPPLVAAAPATVGVLGLWYGLRHRSRSVLLTACLALLCAAWYLGVESGNALGVVLALALTAVLLFWVSLRLGRPDLRNGEAT
jgi:hypothetical protein